MPAAPTLHYVQRANFESSTYVAVWSMKQLNDASSSESTAETETYCDRTVCYMLDATRGTGCESVAMGRRSVLRCDDEELAINNAVIVGTNNQIFGNNNLVIGNYNKIQGDNNRARGDANKMRGRRCTNYDTGQRGSVRGGGSSRIRAAASKGVHTYKRFLPLALSDKSLQKTSSGEEMKSASSGK
jgi:hypothetical protein